MNRQENIKKMYEQAKLDTIIEKDKAVLEKMKEIYLQQSKAESKPVKLSIWSIIMKSKITKLAAAAVLIIGVLFINSRNGGFIDGSSLALGQTIEKMKEMPWIHFKTTTIENDENITESWFGLESKTFASKQYMESKLLFMNSKENTEYTYKENDGVIYYSKIDSRVRDDDYVPDSAFEPVKEMMNYINKYAFKITRKTTTLENREVEIIAAAGIADEENIFDKLELTRDIRENLLLRVKMDYKDVPEYQLSKMPEEVRKQWINSRKDTITTFDYPETGPGSIYELGVPANAKIITSTIPEEIQEIILKLNSLRETSLTRYVAIAISGDSDNLPTSSEGLRNAAFFSPNDKSIYITWRRGDLERRFSQGYFQASEILPTREDILNNIESWAEKINPVREYIYRNNGENQFRQYYFELNGNTVLQNEKTISKFLIYEADESIIENCWPKITVPRQVAMKWSLEYLNGKDNDQLIVISRQLDTVIGKWYINPGKNFICQKYERYNSDGTITNCKEILEYAATESGQIYPRKIQMTKYNQKNNQLVQEVATKIIYLKENPEYPDWIFDPKSLPESDQ
jgi:hypothetical protein